MGHGIAMSYYHRTLSYMRTWRAHYLLQCAQEEPYHGIQDAQTQRSGELHGPLAGDR
jgi:hypothetical protein